MKGPFALAISGPCVASEVTRLQLAMQKPPRSFMASIVYIDILLSDSYRSVLEDPCYLGVESRSLDHFIRMPEPYYELFGDWESVL